MSEMNAIVRRGDKAVLERRPVPEPGPGWLRVRVKLAGVCRTDLLVARGAAGIDGVVLGHEFTGVVDAVGSNGRRALVGRRVVGWPFVGAQQLGVDLDGAFAEYVLVPEANVHAVDSRVDDLAAAYVEPVAAAFGVEQALREPATDRDSRVWVMGEHRIAQLVSKVLEHAGRRVRAGNTPPGGGSFDVVVETDASPASLASAIAVLRPHGRLVLRSRAPAELTLPVAPILEKRLSIVGATRAEPAEAIALLSAGLDVTELAGARFTLERFEEAFAAAGGEERTKPFFEPAPVA